MSPSLQWDNGQVLFEAGLLVLGPDCCCAIPPGPCCLDPDAATIEMQTTDWFGDYQCFTDPNCKDVYTPNPENENICGQQLWDTFTLDAPTLTDWAGAVTGYCSPINDFWSGGNGETIGFWFYINPLCEMGVCTLVGNDMGCVTGRGVAIDMVLQVRLKSISGGDCTVDVQVAVASKTGAAITVCTFWTFSNLSPDHPELAELVNATLPTCVGLPVTCAPMLVDGDAFYPDELRGGTDDDCEVCLINYIPDPDIGDPGIPIVYVDNTVP